MTTNNKDFKVKNGLVVDGNQITLGTAPISFNSATHKLQIYVGGQWLDIADSNDISFMDMGLVIDYDGNPVYIVQGNGVTPGVSKYADGGTPTTTSFSMAFDSGVI